MPLSKFLTIVNPSLECNDFPNEDELAMKFTFKLDPFQKHAIKAIHNEENILVTACTGSGKTLCAEYQIAHSLKKGKRVFYTTPIKALSNQKFHDLKKIYPSVSLMTGDIKFNPNADIVVLTTEILCNLLYKKGSTTENLGLTANLSLENLDSVIFDECHYINNKERGHIWEQSLILLDKNINLTLLSATIDSANLFASWLGELKQKPIHLISTTYRIVPLEHYVIKKDSFETVMDAKEQFHHDVYKRWIQWKEDQEKNQKHQKQLVSNRRLGGYEDPVVGKSDTGSSYIHQLNTTIQQFYNQDMLPALFFVMSRKNCEMYASKVAGSLIDPSDSATVKHIINFHLHRYKDSVQVSQQYFTLTDLLQRGIGFHHSGLLPLLKEIVEILFSKGLIKVLFATETFAVGLNMPTKTVVFTSYRKFDDESEQMRIFTTDEYIQMAGRAGRRGKDTRGYVFYLPDRYPEDVESVKKMMCGSKTKLQSRMKFDYDFILKTVQSNNLDWIKLVQQSYYYEQIRKTILEIEKEKKSAIDELNSLTITEEQTNECKQEESLKESLKNATNATKRKLQSEYESWKNKHHERIWNPLREQYKKKSKLMNDLKIMNEDLNYYEHFETSLEPYFEVLTELNYMKQYRSLTQKGINATEINEANCLILSQIYEENVFKTLNQKEILLILSCMLESDSKEPLSLQALNIPEQIRYILSNTEKFCKTIEKLEHQYKISFHPWNLNYEFIELLSNLFNGSSIGEVCEIFEIMEGNLNRFLLKLLNVVDELKNIAMLNNDVSLLEKLEDVQAYEFYKIAIPESLYLHI